LIFIILNLALILQDIAAKSCDLASKMPKNALKIQPKKPIFSYFRAKNKKSL